MHSPRLLSLILGIACGCTAVAGERRDDGPGPDGFSIGDKEDNFVSNTAQEYIIQGTATVELEEELVGAPEEERMARAEELVSLRQTAIAWFLTQYLIGKEHDAPNRDYGGYGAGAVAKANGYEALEITKIDDRKYSFRFQQIIAGDLDLIDLIPGTTREDGVHEFLLTVGLPTNEEMARLEMNNEWYREAPWDDFKPENVDDERKEDLTLSIEVERASYDAYFDYAALIADDVLDIDIHFGWDYHGAYHVLHAETLFNWLQEIGFEPPMENMEFADLEHDSGAFTKTIRALGRDIEVRVSIFYGKIGSANDTDTDEGGRQLEADVRSSLANHDVVMFSGHSGPFYGFSMANWKKTLEGDLDDSEMRSVPMPEARYQLIVAEGCDTYQIGEAFRHNPAKPNSAYLDVVTTTAASSAGSPAAAQSVIQVLTDVDAQNEHVAHTVKELLRELDENHSYRNELYGIHAIDDNPQLHPYANLELMCSECSAHAECGAGSRCVEVGAGRFCAPECTTDDACPADSTCRGAQHSVWLGAQPGVCVPTSNSCE